MTPHLESMGETPTMPNPVSHFSSKKPFSSTNVGQLYESGLHTQILPSIHDSQPLNVPAILASGALQESQEDSVESQIMIL